ncbi:MAG: YeeE/YedE family protein, partial [Flavobacteriaceae bacterium]
MEWILEPWPWYVSGPLIAMTMCILLYIGKNFGMSSNLRTLCTMCGADKTCD